MKIYIENDNGSRIEVRELEGIGQRDILLMQTNVMLRNSDREAMERELSEKIGKRCVILDRHIEKILGV